MKKGIYEHYRGGEVEVIGIAIADWDGTPQVIYKDVSTGITKVQSLKRFEEKVIIALHPTRKQTRFTFKREAENGI